MPKSVLKVAVAINGDLLFVWFGGKLIDVVAYGAGNINRVFDALRFGLDVWV